MKKFIVFFILIVILGSIYGYSQNNKDYDKFIELSSNKNLPKEERIKNARKAISFAANKNNNILINKAILNYGHVTLNLSMYIETIKILQNAIEKCDFEKDSITLGIMINTQGVAFGELSQRPTAIRLFEKALQIFKKVNYKKGILQALNNIGLVYYYNNEYKKAKKYFLDLLSTFDKDSYHFQLGSTYLNLGHIYVTENNFEKGKYYYNKIIENPDSVSENLYSLSFNGLSRLYLKLGNTDKALELISKTENFKNISPKFRHVSFKITKGDIFAERNNLIKAKEAYTYALRYAEKLNLINNKLEILKKQANLYNQLNQTNKAYNTLSNAYKILDSLKNSETEKNSELQEDFFLHQQEKYKLMKEKNKIELLEHKAQLKINKQRLFLIILISIFILSLILIIAVVKSHKNKIKYINETNKLKLDFQLETAAKLESEINLKIEQFTEVAMILSQQNDFLKDIKSKLDKIKIKDSQKITDIKIRLSSVINANQEKEVFYNAVENINSQIISDLKNKFPNITDNDIRLICLSKLNLSNKEISGLLGTSVKNIEMAKYRLKKKLDLNKNESLEDLITNYKIEPQK